MKLASQTCPARSRDPKRVPVLSVSSNAGSRAKTGSGGAGVTTWLKSRPSRGATKGTAAQNNTKTAQNPGRRRKERRGGLADTGFLYHAGQPLPARQPLDLTSSGPQQATGSAATAQPHPSSGGATPRIDSGTLPDYFPAHEQQGVFPEHR